MSDSNAATGKEGQSPLLPGFEPFENLWQRVPPLFPSAQSARWFRRVHNQELVEAQALAKPFGVLLVHPERVRAVLERHAFAAVAGKVETK